MKASEICIGDWFKAIDYNSPFRITAIYDDVVQTQADYQSEIDGNWYSEVEIKDLVPIELTSDILEKNGFEYERNVGYIFDDYDGNVVIYDDYSNRLKILQNHDVSFNRECFSKVCVHYLQHALRLCEIRKEIEL